MLNTLLLLSCWTGTLNLCQLDENLQSDPLLYCGNVFTVALISIHKKAKQRHSNRLFGIGHLSALVQVLLEVEADVFAFSFGRLDLECDALLFAVLVSLVQHWVVLLALVTFVHFSAYMLNEV